MRGCRADKISTASVSEWSEIAAFLQRRGLPENIASQALAKALGYWNYGEMTTYLWRKD